MFFFQDTRSNGKRPSMSSLSTIRVSKSPSNSSHISGCPSHTSNKSHSTHAGSDDNKSNLSSNEDSDDDRRVDATEAPEINEVNVVYVQLPDECCPGVLVRRCPCCEAFNQTSMGKKWWAYRCYMYTLVEHKYFETFIIVMIVASSLALVCICSFYQISTKLLVGYC